MELVYLWVEDYKNIHKQGFNFSPRFRCEFKDEYEKYIDTDGKEKEKLKDNCELIVNGNKDYVTIFPDNINITAIVGENGSGKSSILTKLFITGLTLDPNFTYTPEEKYILFFDDNSVHTNIDFLNYEKTQIPFIKHEKLNENSFSKDYIELIKNYKLFNSVNSEINLKTYNYIPVKIKLEFKHGLIDRMIEDLHIIEDKENIKIFLKKNKALISILIQIDLGNNNNKDIVKELFLNKNIDDFIKKTENTIKYQIQLKIKDIADSKYHNITENNIEIISEISSHTYDINFLNKDNVSFEDLSSGEKEWSYMFLKSYYEIVSNKSNNIVYGFDEPDNFLHPYWQKRFINDLINVFQNSKKIIHFIITSHSAFLLSDLPKQNVIFLEKNEKTGNCINASDKVDINPFGANIHTLLSHGFFMKDGLMGEFAKDKIKSIINYHEEIKELTKEENKSQRDEEKEKYENEHKNKFWQIQSIIGDDYLKQVIKNHLIEIEKIVLGNDEAKDEEIKRLKAQIELLEK